MQATYKEKLVRITVNFPMETLKAKRMWNSVLEVLKDCIASLEYYIYQNYLS